MRAEEGLRRATKTGGRGLQEQRGGGCSSGRRTEAEYQEGRAREKVQGKIDKEFEGQAWIKEHSERVIFKGI